ncbi:MAG TPA: type II toxin-antitoxin system VapC family toxin [Sporichthyaceae bacterium]|nr:type II toxin-antitoxin system VapC family toxin [Sporichthyaceae bacterium]
MLIYLDSSALLKLVRAEAETEALVDWLNQRPDAPVVCSELGRVEVLRAARRIGTAALDQARAVVADLDLVPVDRAVQDVAAEIGEPGLRTLDAVHLASAVLLGEALTAFVAYDQRLRSAAELAALPTYAPGPATI